MKIYNSLSRDKEEFNPLSSDRSVKMYVCGVTPYDSPHLGHALSAARFNMLRNYLEFRGFKVTYVQNVTDVDDKIINRSESLGIPPRELSERYTLEYNQGLRKLGLRTPDYEPKVSEYIPQICEYVQRLIANGAAYATSDGDVYFDVTKQSDYGKLSGRDLKELMSGTREEVRENKRNPLDFALWKHDETPGASWPSPWGQGRPGWHIECSVMCNSLLGPQIDIHGGGLDLIFPHHENEIAQCEAHNHAPFAKYWAHNGLLMVDGKKMSKSLGNFLTIDDAIQRYGVPLIMFVIMKFHYRSPVDFTEVLFRDSLNSLADFYWTRARVATTWVANSGANVAYIDTELQKILGDLENAFVEAMDNDFNTPIALTVLSSALKSIDAYLEAQQFEAARALQDKVEALGRVLGIFPDNYPLERVLDDGLRFQAFCAEREAINSTKVDELLRERDEARSKKDFKRSDVLRDELLKAGVRVLDKRTGSSAWQFATGAIGR